MGIQARVWCRLIGFFLTASLIVTFQHVQADTLTEQLASESPETLVRDAREAGNIVRGAILFHQGKINCAKCHQNSSNEQDIAPNLRSLGAEVSVTSLVESILEPSKSISKGYETTKVLTVDGKVLTGLLVSKNEAGVIIRDQQDVNQLRQIRVEEIEEISASKTSIMPAGLADELSSRQQFLDLLRYVIDLKERGPIEKHRRAKAWPLARRWLHVDYLPR